MDLTYNRAALSDLEAVMALVSAAIDNMELHGIRQWDSVYPSRSDFQRDIEAGNLTLGVAGGQLCVIYALNQECDDAYAKAQWQYQGDRFAVLHRLCVAPEMQGQGIAKAALCHLEKTLRAEGCCAVRLDVFTENPFALRLYAHHGYRQTGTADWRKGRFLLMEKLL